jgi:hypothetical protein
MCRYRITGAGRLIDSAGNDLEPDGYITFYTVDREDGEARGGIPGESQLNGGIAVLGDRLRALRTMSQHRTASSIGAIPSSIPAPRFA